MLDTITTPPVVLHPQIIKNYSKIVTQAELLFFIHLWMKLASGEKISLNEIGQEMGYDSSRVYELSRGLQNKGLLVAKGENGKAMDYDTSPFFKEIERVSKSIELNIRTDETGQLQLDIDSDEIRIDSSHNTPHTSLEKGNTVYYKGKKHLYIASVLKVNKVTVEIAIPLLDKSKRVKPKDLLIKGKNGVYGSVVAGEIKQKEKSETYKEVVEKLFTALGIDTSKTVSLSLTGQTESGIYKVASNFDQLIQKHQGIRPETIDAFSLWFQNKNKRKFRNVYEMEANWAVFQNEIAGG